MISIKKEFAGINGFTLVEIIATIIVMGILAAFFIHFMGTAMDDSWKSVELVTGEAEAEGKIEEIIAYFTSKINDDPATALNAVKNNDFGSNVTKDYINFDGGGNEIPAVTSNNLKITIEAPGNNLAAILTKSRVNSSDPVVNY